MKKLFTLILFLLSFVGFSQSGDGYVNYTSYRTQCNTGCVFSRTVDGTSVTVSGHMSDTAEFDAAMTVANGSSSVVGVLNSGETQAFSAGGFGTATNSYNGGRPIGPGNSQGEYYIVDYTGWFYASSTGNYKFHTWSDDSHEFWLDLDGDDVLESTEMITKKYNGSGNNASTDISLTSGTWYKLRVRFHEFTGGDWMRIQYQDPTNNGGTTWRILGDTTWGDKVSNSEPAPTFVNTVANDGQNAITYKSFKINDYASNNNQGEYNAHPTNSAGFDDMFDYANKNTTTWTHQGRDTATKAFTWPWSNILPRHANDNFGWIIDAYFVPPTSGTYKFQLNSDDRSDFWFDANDDGTITNTGIGLGNGSREVDVTNLTAGVSYKFRVRYEQGAGGANLYLKWKSPEDVAAGAAFAFNGNSIYSIDADDVTVTMDYTVNYNIDPDITATDFSVKTYYESGTNQFTANAGQSAVTLASNGSADISDQIDTDFSKVQHVVFDEPSSTDLATTAAAAVTVADVYLAFQELTDRGINNNQSGNKFTYGIQYVNADIDKDGDFDFDDTFVMLDWLNGGTEFSLTNLSSVMRLIETSTYNSVPSTAIGNYATTSKFPLGLTNGTTTYTKNITVSWLGDINLSHSPTPTNNLSVTGMTIGNAPSISGKRMYMSNASTVELYIENEIKEGKVYYKIRSTYGSTDIGAIQLKLKYNKDLLLLSDHNFESGGTDFINDTDWISFGSLKTGEGSLNSLSTYEFIFDTKQEINGSLGLLLLEVIEAISTDNKQVNILLQ